MMPAAPKRAIGPWLLLAALLALVAASFASLPLRWSDFFTEQAYTTSAEFLRGFAPPDLQPAFVRKTLLAALETLSMSALGTLLAVGGGLALALPAAVETLAMSLLGTLLAVVGGLLLALPASKLHADDPARWRAPARLVLNVLRSVPELMWAALLLIAAGLGPFAGTLALAVHTTGVLGRLFAESMENAPPGPAFALRVRGVPEGRVVLYATLPQVLPQLISYSLYRWENNIRAAAILGVVGAGGLGQMLKYHLSLFQMQKAATVIIAMLLLVALVDAISFALRRALTR